MQPRFGHKVERPKSCS